MPLFLKSTKTQENKDVVLKNTCRRNRYFNLSEGQTLFDSRIIDFRKCVLQSIQSMHLFNPTLLHCSTMLLRTGLEQAFVWQRVVSTITPISHNHHTDKVNGWTHQNQTHTSTPCIHVHAMDIHTHLMDTTLPHPIETQTKHMNLALAIDE